jgi:hypothetical protein
VPRVVERGRSVGADRRLLIAGCIVFCLSWYFSSPLIQGQDTAFVTHFLGGGVFTACVWRYGTTARRAKLAWWVDAALLYGLVSASGVANELFELFLSQSGIAFIPATDTWWDLLANTSGAATGWIILKITQH